MPVAPPSSTERMVSGPATRTSAGRPLAHAIASATSVLLRSNGACSWSITTKSNPASPMISTPWPVGVLRNVPTSVWRASRRARKLAAVVIRGDSCPSACVGAAFRRPWHRIFGRVQHPAWLFGEVDARRAEDVHELVGPLPHRLGGVDGGGGMTAMDGVPHSSCWSSRHIALSMPHGQRKWWMNSPETASDPCSKSSWKCGDRRDGSRGPSKVSQ